jgi:hypothetical protein
MPLIKLFHLEVGPVLVFDDLSRCPFLDEKARRFRSRGLRDFRRCLVLAIDAGNALFEIRELLNQIRHFSEIRRLFASIAKSRM